MSTLFAIGLGDGKLVWHKSICGDGHLWMVPVVADGVVYAGCDAGQMFALDAETGDKKWELHTKDSPRSPVVANGKVYFGVTASRDETNVEKLLAVEA